MGLSIIVIHRAIHILRYGHSIVSCLNIRNNEECYLYLITFGYLICYHKNIYESNKYNS